MVYIEIDIYSGSVDRLRFARVKELAGLDELDSHLKK